MSYRIDPLSIATDGLLSDIDTLDISLRFASNGYLITIEEDIVYAPPEINFGGGGYAQPSSRKKRKRFTVSVVINETVYTDVVETDDLSVSVSNIKVELDTNYQTPRLKATIIS